MAEWIHSLTHWLHILALVLTKWVHLGHVTPLRFSLLIHKMGMLTLIFVRRRHGNEYMWIIGMQWMKAFPQSSFHEVVLQNCGVFLFFVFLLHGMQDLSSNQRSNLCLCSEIRSRNHWTSREVPPELCFMFVSCWPAPKIWPPPTATERTAMCLVASASKWQETRGTRSSVLRGQNLYGAISNDPKDAGPSMSLVSWESVSIVT